MGKYEALGRFLSQQRNKEIPLRFADVERITGTKLPQSAHKHRSWWSNTTFAARRLRGGLACEEQRMASSFLPGAPPRDPTDRISAATARDYGATLITRDGALLLYGEQGHINVLAC